MISFKNLAPNPFAVFTRCFTEDSPKSANKGLMILKAAIESDIYQPRIVEQESKSAPFDAKPHYIVSWRLSDGRFE